MTITDNYVFFFKGSDWPSNFYITNFTYTEFGETHEFFCSEQAFMWAKAMMFHDRDIANLILKENIYPDICKRLGRSVRNYNDSVWTVSRTGLMQNVLLAKFAKGNELHDILLSKEFDNKQFVEASPYDKVWGIGLSEDKACVTEQRYWPGVNLLGDTLNAVRHMLKQSTDFDMTR